MTRADRILIVVLLAVAVLCVPLVSLAMPAAGSVTITGPEGQTQIDPSVNGTFRVAGRLGSVTIVVRDGVVSCSQSGCPDHICVRAGSLAPGKPIICAPNGVVVAYDARSEGGLDAVSR